MSEPEFRPWEWWGRFLIGLLGLVLLLGVVFTPRPAQAATVQEAVFAGGCFWCLEHDLEGLPGVLQAESGYSGGDVDQPTYAQVSSGGTGHQESVRVRFDADQLSYGSLLQAYWRQIDPFDDGGQFCDRGTSYRPVIFAADADQQLQAEGSLVDVARALQVEASELKVEVRPHQPFWEAEAYHQDYAKHHQVAYTYYRWACGRDRRLAAIWGSSGKAATLEKRGEASPGAKS